MISAKVKIIRLNEYGYDITELKYQNVKKIFNDNKVETDTCNAEETITIVYEDSLGLQRATFWTNGLDIELVIEKN